MSSCRATNAKAYGVDNEWSRASERQVPRILERLARDGAGAPAAPP